MFKLSELRALYESPCIILAAVHHTSLVSRINTDPNLKLCISPPKISKPSCRYFPVGMSRQAFIAWNSSAPIFGAPGTPSINAAASWYCQLRQVREPQPEKTALAITALAASPVGYMGSRSHKTISTSEKVWTLPASRSIGRVRLPWWSSSLPINRNRNLSGNTLAYADRKAV